MHKGNKLFYGWWMVVAITILFFIGGTAPFAIVLKQLMEQMHTGRGEVSLSQSITMVGSGIAGIIVGRLMLRYRPRTFILWGSVVSGVTLLLLSLANSLWFLYVFYLIAGLAVGFCNAIAYFTLLSKWFTRRWGAALGIVMAGGSIGSMVMQPVVGIIAQNFGWRATYLFAGSLILAINVPLIIFVLKDSPESMGLLPDGDKSKEIGSNINAEVPVQTTTESTFTAQNTGLLSYLKKPAFWFMGISFTFIAIGSNAITTQEVSFITDMKVSTTVAAAALGITFGIGAISSLVSGWLADKLMSRYVAILFFLYHRVFVMIIAIYAAAILGIYFAFGANPKPLLQSSVLCHI